MIYEDQYDYLLAKARLRRRIRSVLAWAFEPSRIIIATLLIAVAFCLWGTP